MNDVSRELYIDPQRGMTHRSVWSSERRMDIRDVGAVLPCASGFVHSVERLHS